MSYPDCIFWLIKLIHEVLIGLTNFVLEKKWCQMADNGCYFSGKRGSERSCERQFSANWLSEFRGNLKSSYISKEVMKLAREWSLLDVIVVLRQSGIETCHALWISPWIWTQSIIYCWRVELLNFMNWVVSHVKVWYAPRHEGGVVINRSYSSVWRIWRETQVLYLLPYFLLLFVVAVNGRLGVFILALFKILGVFVQNGNEPFIALLVVDSQSWQFLGKCLFRLEKVRRIRCCLILGLLSRLRSW
jgi:hypothetical protein